MPEFRYPGEVPATGNDTTGTSRLRDASPSRVAIAGHPVHPMIVPFPVAFLTLLPISDLIYWAGDDPFWARVSYVLALAGLISAGVAAIFGLLEFVLVQHARETRAGWIHLGANLAVAGLTLANVLVRAADHDAMIVPTGALISLVTLALLVVSGWYGGELAYRHRVGVMPTEVRPPPSGALRPGRR